VKSVLRSEIHTIIRPIIEKNMMPSTNPELHNVSQLRRRRTEPRS